MRRIFQSNTSTASCRCRQYSATISEGRVYVGSDDGYVYCLAADTGSLIWKHKASPAERWMFSFSQLTSAWPVRTDIVVDKGVAYFGVGVFPHDGTFVCATIASQTEKIKPATARHTANGSRWAFAHMARASHGRSGSGLAPSLVHSSPRQSGTLSRVRAIAISALFVTSISAAAAPAPTAAASS